MIKIYVQVTPQEQNKERERGKKSVVTTTSPCPSKSACNTKPTILFLKRQRLSMRDGQEDQSAAGLRHEKPWLLLRASRPAGGSQKPLT